ncbi:Zinc finger protein [Echinococcus granulosus]|uniref:Zinc finger protein 830 n=1 Tax=Echinococcus granulosus TaxID=6210 RepID=U6IZP2_ECHGR|nr:Zinc finger protein [Echinococcus granulosus]EUB64417.1 Zinc finger protein [Echinococcus granulosus]CDS17209.1 zinc finger protein 830 [Echinococcus granulosus]
MRYNPYGKISCIVCGIPIKSEITWKAHVLSKSHKDNAIRGTDSLKRIQTQVKDNTPPAKHPKLEVVVPKSEALNLKKEEKLSLKVPDPSRSPHKEKEGTQNCLLPEGFFDDARRDAEVRNVPFKDKMDTEMEVFRKEVGTLDQELEQILEKDNEEMVVARNLAEVDKQISMWEKFRELEMQKEASISKKKIVKSEGASIKVENEDDDSDSGDTDEDELNDFRFKAGIR